MLKNSVVKVHWSDKTPIAFIAEISSVRLLSGTIVLKCDLRYRDLRYQIEKTFDWSL